MNDLNNYTNKITNIFETCHNRYDAHRQVQPIIIEMAKNTNILHQIIRINVAKPDFFLQTRINPVIALPIIETPEYSMVANCWLPLPTRSTNISHQSIHHHGSLLLTTIAAYGIGYESILFKNNFQIDKNSEKATLNIDKIYHNYLYSAEFIDANTPHIVFYPPSLSVTYACWSTKQKLKSDTFKKVAFLKKYKKPLKKILDATKISKLLGLNVITYFDFSLNEQKQPIALKNRVQYQKGTQDNFIQNFFYLLQQIQFDDINFLKNLPLPINLKNTLAPHLDKLAHKQPILDSFEPTHLNVNYINLVKSDIIQTFSPEINK